MSDDSNKTLTPADIGTVVAIEGSGQYAAGRLAGYLRRSGTPITEVWFEHNPLVVAFSSMNVVRWDVPSRVTVEGNGTQGAVATVDWGMA